MRRATLGIAATLSVAAALLSNGCGSDDSSRVASPGPARAEASPAPPPTDAAARTTPASARPGTKRAIAYARQIAGGDDTTCGSATPRASLGTTTAADAATAADARDPGCVYVAAFFGCLVVADPQPGFGRATVRKEFEDPTSDPKLRQIFDEAVKACT